MLVLQFHLETTPDGLRALVKNCPEGLRPGRWVQTEAEMLKDAGRFDRAHHLMAKILEHYEALVT